jgi:hypothetical protein
MERTFSLRRRQDQQKNVDKNHNYAPFEWHLEDVPVHSRYKEDLELCTDQTKGFMDWSLKMIAMQTP